MAFAGSLLVAGLLLCLANETLAVVEAVHLDLYELAADERLEAELWLRTDEATLAGTAEDDLSILARTLTLSGSFDGDVNALASEQLIFSGDASDQLRLLALQVQLDGTARKSLVALARSIAMSPDARLEDAAVLVADTVVTEGYQQGPLWVLANKATIQGELHGSLWILAEDIVIQPGTTIHGDVTYSSPEELIPGSKVTIHGELKRTVVGGPGLTYGGYLMILTAMFLSTLLLGIPLIRFFPRTIGLSAGMIREATGRCILSGMVAVWVLPMFVAAFLLVPLTLPLGLALLCGLVFFGFLSQILVALVLGSLVWRQPAPSTFSRIGITYFLGLLLLYILAAAPILNVMVWIFTATLGLGGLVMGTLASQQLIGQKSASNQNDDPEGGPPPVPDTDSPDELNQP